MKKEKKKKSFRLLGFLFESKTSLFLIGSNCFVFWYILNYSIEEEVLSRFILYPGNLLNGEFLCLLTSGFIHFDISHLLWNMLAVFIFARIVERNLGITKTLIIYFGALTISMLFSTGVYVFVLHKNVAIIGASGAVMGLLATAMLLEPFCFTYEMILPIPVMVKGWMFFYADIKGFMSNENDGVSHLAHLFGFLSIALLVYFLSNRDRKLLRTGLFINIISFITFLLLRNWLIQKL